MNRSVLFAAALVVALAQIGFLASMIMSRAAILRDGDVVTLAVRPVDPRDLLRGDYVVLGYNISSIDTALIENPPRLKARRRGRPIFVRLEADDEGIWQPTAARFGRKPRADAEDGAIDIRGVATHFPASSTGSVGVDYGIERFYVPEGEGRWIEQDMAQRRFLMRVAVSRKGSAQIKSFHDGETMLYEEPLF